MLKQMFWKIGQVTFLLSLTMLFAAFSSILLGRILNPADFGQFGLARTLILFIPTIAVWGQDISIARYFSRSALPLYAWKKTLNLVLLVFFVLAITGVLTSTFIYDLPVWMILSVGCGVLCYGVNILLSSIFRSQGNYKSAVILLSGFRGLYFLLLVPIFFIGHLSVQSAVIAYAAIILVNAAIGWRSTLKIFPQGEKTVPREMHLTGLVFMGISISVNVMASLDSLVISKVLGYETLGLYIATLVPVQAFNILGRAAKYVWVPEFSRNRSLKWQKLNLFSLLPVLLVAAFFYCTAEWILEILYHDKYLHGAPLLRILTFVGAIRVLYNLPSSIITGRLGLLAIRWHFILSILLLVVYSATLIWVTPRYGVMGVGYTLLGISVVRLLAGYWVVHKFPEKDEETKD